MNLLSEIYFWTAREDVSVKHTEFGAFKYYTGKREANGDLLCAGKRDYYKRRGGTWHLTNKRPRHKMKEKLRELEEHLYEDRIVCCSWTGRELRLLLSKGLWIAVTLSAHDDAIQCVSFDRSLTSKIGPESICDAAAFGEHVAYICTDGRVSGTWSRDGPATDCCGKRRIRMGDGAVVVWGSTNVEHPQPWSPLTKDYRRANLLLYKIGPRGLEMFAHKKTEGEPIEVAISRRQRGGLIIILVEQKVSSRGSVSVEVGVLEAHPNKFKSVSVTSVPLQTQVSCCALSDDEARLALACIDGSVAVLDRDSGSTRIVKASIIPTFTVWHGDGAVLAVANVAGQVQYFDAALNRIGTRLSADDSIPTGLLDLSVYFGGVRPNVSFVHWGPKDLLVALERGPLILISHLDDGGSLTFASLIRRYLKAGEVEKSTGLLLSWEWNDRCFGALQRIVAHLLKSPLTEANARNLQHALSSFHNPHAPLLAQVRHKYGSQVRALTRRFFHQLTRYGIFETAFLLAVDVGHHDLFMDLYYCAEGIGEKEMAAAARAQASALLSRCSSEASHCSRSSCSKCSGSYSEDGGGGTSSSSGSEDAASSSLDYNSKQSPAVPSDACQLTTSFNEANPKTYDGFGDYYPSLSSVLSNVVDLPKVTIATRPPAFSNRISSVARDATPYVPPLPITPSHLLYARNFHLSPPVTSLPMVCGSRSNDAPVPPLPVTPPPCLGVVPLPVLPPPPSSLIIDGGYSGGGGSNSNNSNSGLGLGAGPPGGGGGGTGGKKQQAKVKFSDTVTAFIVPEVKRPVRPPPPPHITDPQKELADSLPLCHPNEDYLKDFTPVRRSNDRDEPSSTSSSDGTTATTKIKVVHFGVV